MKRHWFARLGAAVLCFLLLLSLAPAAGAEAEDGADEIVGEWIWSSTVADAGAGGAEELMSRCSELGVTDVYLLVKGTAGTISWLETAYTDNLARTDRDVLQEVIDAAHPRGIRVHAWLCSLEDAAYKDAHPESGVWHYVRERDNNIINPYDEGYRAYMCDLVTELVANYDIDGLHFDYIRYNHAANGWGETDIAALEAMGADIDHLRALIDASFYDGEGQTVFEAYNSGDRDALILAQYRRDNVVDFAEQLIAAARRADPSVVISAALQPDGATDPAFGNIHYGQSYEDAADLYDYILPMAYSADFSRDSGWVADVAEAAVSAGNRVVVGLQAYSPVTTAQLLSDISAVEALRTEAGGSVLGFALFRNGTFGSARVSLDAAEGVMDISVSSPEAAYTWIQVELQDGLTATACEAVSGLDAESTELSSDGKTVRLSGEALLPERSLGTLRIRFSGEAGSEPALVRAGGETESRVLNVYGDAASPALPFTDVAEGDWFFSAVEYVSSNGIMEGTTETLFAPEASMTRAMVWAILARMDGESVTGEGWIEAARSWAVSGGVSDGENPTASVTREQLATMLWRYAGESESAYSLDAYSDAASVSGWAEDAMRWAVGNGIITGVSAAELAPGSGASRAQAAAMLMRYRESAAE